MVSSLVTSALVTYTGYYVRCASNGSSSERLTLSLGPIHAPWTAYLCHWYWIPHDSQSLKSDYAMGNLHRSCRVGDWNGGEHALYRYSGCHGQVSSPARLIPYSQLVLILAIWHADVFPFVERKTSS